MGVGVYCINNSGSVVECQCFLSVVFAFEHDISESNKDSKFECRTVNDFRHNRTQWVRLHLSPRFFCIDATLLCEFESDKI